MITDIFLLCALAACARVDIRRKELPMPLLGVCAAAGVIFFLLRREHSLPELLGGVCVGGILLLSAALCRESIGFGDGLLFCATGLYLGLWENLLLLFFAAVFCAAAGGILVLQKKYTRKQTLPFAPFVLLSDVVMLAIIQ